MSSVIHGIKQHFWAIRVKLLASLFLVMSMPSYFSHFYFFSFRYAFIIRHLQKYSEFMLMNGIAKTSATIVMVLVMKSFFVIESDFISR